MAKKPIDEDRARRKEALEQKKAERKKAAAAAVEAEATQQLAALARLSTTTNVDSVTTTVTANNGVCSNNDDTNNNNENEQPQQISVFDLPLDAMHLICSMLCVSDLGRFLLLTTVTTPTVHHILYTVRTSYLFSRLCTITSNSPSSTQLCTTEQEARTILDHLLSLQQPLETATTDHNNPKHTVSKSLSLRKKMSSNHDANDMMTTIHDATVLQQFLCYLRFIEEMVTGYATIHSRNRQPRNSSNNNRRIQLPTFVHGRFVSISPEHSIVRMGGTVHNNVNGNCSGIATWGVGKRGQLGHHQRQDLRYPTRVRYGIGYTSPDVRIVQVSAGGGLVRVAHTLLLTSTGRVLSFGTGQYGALGHGYNAAKQLPDVLKPTYIDALLHVPCICVAAGELHSAAITCDGDVYTWGDGFCGQLGHADKRPITIPKQVTTGGLSDECVTNISCGSRHTIAVTEDGECYSWGLGHFGVLGRSYTPFEYDADTAVHTFATTALGENGTNGVVDPPHALQRLAIANVVPPPPPPPNENGGPSVLAALHNQQQVPRIRDTAAELAAHLNLIANLTLDDSSDQCIPKLVDSLQGIQLVGASAGHRHSLFLDINGYLYSCGAGSSGCLGHANTESCMYPCRIAALYDDETDIRFRQMSAGVDISMGVSTTGMVYAWGKTEGGRIGLGMAKSQITKPRRVYLNDTTKNAITENPSIENDSVKYKAVDVECGYVHSIIVALDGTTYICGGVGVEGEDDGQQQQQQEHQSEETDDMNTNNNGWIAQSPQMGTDGRPKQIPNLTIWESLPEPKDEIVKKERWQKMGKYEVKGRSKMS